jgi:DUF4097 and DUF4098 domain-containing protein YvlB
MRTKILGSVLVVLTVLGGLQLFQNMTSNSRFGDSELVEVNFDEGDLQSIISKVRSTLENVDNERSEQGEVMIEKSFNVNKGDDLVIAIEHSDVDIETGGGSEATITVTLDSRNSDRARARFEEMEWKVYQEGGTVHVEAESPRRNWSFNVNMDIHVLITIPSTFNLDLQTSHGDVNLGDIDGKVNLLTSHGDVSFEGIEGDLVWIRSSHGDISGVSLRSDRVEVETSHADIEIAEIDAKSLNASTSHADIEIEHLIGAADLTTSHGNIRVFLAGDEDASLSTSHGNIDISMDANSGADLDFKAPQIHMDRDLNVRVKGESRNKSVSESINGGGRTIQARTTHGSIEMSNR